jgi:hypothetical protein
MVKVTRKQYLWGLVLYSIAALVMSFGVWLGAKTIFDGSYATIVKILVAMLCLVWGAAVVVAGYFVWRIKRDIC